MTQVRWLARSVAALPGDVGWLAPGEVERAAQLSYPRRRTGYLLKRLAAKHAVAATLGLPTEADELARIEVRNDPSGAPYVLLDGQPAAWAISLSDRGDWAVCVVGHGAVGCDLEIVEPRSAGFVADFLTAAEKAYVAEQPEGEARAVAANLVWSAKESALKVLRTGLRQDTRSVEVSVDVSIDVSIATGLPRSWSGSWSRLTVSIGDGLALSGWWRRFGDYLITVVSDPASTPPVALEPTGLDDVVRKH